ncbi:MAG: hypothetical protein H7067_01570 [Burkholderiales bacterium]|nr:hypothetical protein [Opitutaceae bacterium]
MKPTIKAKRTRPAATRKAPRSASVKGDIARAMFARWEKDHIDPRPMSWSKLKTTLEENRLRETPLFSK